MRVVVRKAVTRRVNDVESTTEVSAEVELRDARDSLRAIGDAIADQTVAPQSTVAGHGQAPPAPPLSQDAIPSALVASTVWRVWPSEADVKKVRGFKEIDAKPTTAYAETPVCDSCYSIVSTLP